MRVPNDTTSRKKEKKNRKRQVFRSWHTNVPHKRQVLEKERHARLVGFRARGWVAGAPVSSLQYHLFQWTAMLALIICGVKIIADKQGGGGATMQAVGGATRPMFPLACLVAADSLVVWSGTGVSSYKYLNPFTSAVTHLFSVGDIAPVPTSKLYSKFTVFNKMTLNLCLGTSVMWLEQNRLHKKSKLRILFTWTRQEHMARKKDIQQKIPMWTAGRKTRQAARLAVTK